MKNFKIFFIGLICAVAPMLAYANNLDASIAQVQKNCGNISDELSDIKTMAGVNTAVTGVGTAVGAGALATGIVKAKTDRELQQTKEIIAQLESEGAIAITTQDEFAEIFGGFLIDTGDPELASVGHAIQKKNELEKKSKNLGNWRTGLLATSTATNIAGAVIAGTNQVKDDLQTKINQCILSVNKLRTIYMQERIKSDVDNAQIVRAEKIVAECSAWETADITPINNRARGAAISSGVGAGVGLAGTITSGVANSGPVRGGDWQKEKSLNTAANVIAGGATVASAAATVFNATQIAAAKKIIDIADKCEEVLK